MVNQPQLDINTEARTARRLPDGSVAPFQPAPSDNLTTQNVEAHGVNVANMGQGLNSLGEGMQQVASQQIQAQQATYMMNTGNKFKLEANKILEDSKRNVQPGESISQNVQGQVDKLQKKYSEEITNPTLQKAFEEHSGQTIGSINDIAQAYDFQERDRYALFNYTQGTNSAAKTIAMAPTYDLAEKSSHDALGEAMHTISQMNILPAEKEKLQLQTIQMINEAQSLTKMRIDKTRWLAEHFPALTPQGREEFSADVPRGIRNNNPGNLKGDDQWQGRSGTDNAGYIKFDTPESGIRALNINLMNQQDKHGLNTVSDIIGKFAPSNENDTKAYISDVADQMGVKPDQKINMHDDDQRQTMVQAIIRHENGGAQPYHPASTTWAALSANGKDAGPQPSATRPDGTVRNNDPVWSSDTYQNQQKLLTDFIQLQKSEKYLGLQYETQANAQMGVFTNNLSKGVVPDDNELKQVSELVKNSNSPALQQRFEKLVYQSQMTRQANTMSSDAIESTINGFDAQPPSQARDTALAFYQGYMKTRNTAISKDPLGYWHEQGNELPGLNFNDPKSILQRQQIAYKVGSQYGVSPVDAFLRDDDRSYLSSGLQSVNARSKLTTLNVLQANLNPEMYNGVINSLRKDNSVIAAAGDYLGLSRSTVTPHWFGKDETTSSSDVANALAQGDSLLHPADKSKPFPMPSDEKLRTSIPTEYQQVFRGLPQAETAAFEATKAYYAYGRSQSGDFSGGEPDLTAWKDAYQKVLGHTTKFNGAYALAPWGMNESAFRDNMQKAYTDQIAKSGINVKTFPFGSVSFQNTGEMGKYLIQSGNGYMVDKDGRPVTVDLTQLNQSGSKP